MAKKFPVSEITKVLISAFPGFQIAPKKQSNNSMPFLVKKDSETYYVKVIDSEAQHQEGLDEVELLKGVSSDSVIPLISSGIIDDSYQWLQFPNIEGETIDRIKTEWDSESIKALLRDMAHAVRDIWDGGVVHRDVKPKNIIRKKGNGYVLLDLGIGYFMDQQDRDTTKARGSRHYSAPEQFMAILGDDIDISFATDHFSLGVVAYELATGINPFQQFPKSYTSVGEAICQYDPEPPIGINKAISPELSSLIMRLLNKSPSKRFASPQILIDELEGKTSKPASKLKLYLHAPNSTLDYLEYHNTRKSDSQLDGMVVSIGSSEDKIKQIKQSGLELLIDPKTYKLRYPKPKQATLRAKLRVPERKNLTGMGLADKDFLKKLTTRVIDLQQSATQIILPYFAIRSTSDGILEINKSCWKIGRDYVNEKGLKVPILGGLMLSRDIVTNTKSRTDLLDRLIGCSQFLDGYYIIFQNEDDTVHPITEVDFLTGIDEILGLLGSLGNIVVDYADPSILPLLHNGTVACSNEKFARCFPFSKHIDNPKEQKGRPKEEDIKLRIYSDPLYDFLEEKATLGILSDLGFESELTCECEFCAKAKPFDQSVPKSLKDSERHFYIKITEHRNATNGLGYEDWTNFYLNKLENSVALGKKIAALYSRERFAQHEGLISIIKKR